MPKMKTSKTVAKRIKVTAGGKFMRRKAGRGHLLSTKSPKRIRGGRKATTVPKAFAKHVRRKLGI